MLIGVLAAIAGIGLVKIIEGYLFSRQNSETVQKAQIAMTRIVKELGGATTITPTTAETVTSSVSCTRLPGPVTHTIALSDGVPQPVHFQDVLLPYGDSALQIVRTVSPFAGGSR